ncbi:uroporphyrinogen-III C-methyltransferase [Saccharococcus caldoxylosilyticus]|uniref:Uroporphyrinogen-III C-methyltransferase n=1 Tax=Saccharococcus caldoxylosilyticus TaxID=81408 RepID=A0A150LWE5_9BACL|nr:uroporphyrinogen-III C-methyltransferase [Parageobacillus caldoxylosilyticus]KYD16521.1 Uroporphyrinogen-III methyltransferase [Parageobacillus caldoxylosilyticus]
MGKVYLVGTGPGDPELLTVKGVRCIQEADVILYDRLVDPMLLQYAKQGAELVYCGKKPRHHSVAQETINQLLVRYAKQGKVVTRLKGGDPFIYGRGAEEAETLAKAQVAFEIVPGITAGIAAPAYAGIPLTHRRYGSTIAFVTGHVCEENEEKLKWEHIANIDTIVVYMGIRRLAYIQQQLLRYGRSPHTPAAFIFQGTTEQQRTVVSTLENLTKTAKKERIQNPAIIVIGDVVRLHETISWFRPYCNPLYSQC